MHDELEQETGLESMTKAELQAEARIRGLSAGGARDALLRRIQDHEQGSGDAGAVEHGGGAEQTGQREGDGELAEAEAEVPAEAQERSDGAAASADRERADGEGGDAAEQAEQAEDAEQAQQAEPAKEAEPAERTQQAEEAEPAQVAEDQKERAEPSEDQRAGGDRAAGADEDEPARTETGQAKPDGGGDGIEPGELTKVLTAAAESLTTMTGRPLDAVSGVRDTDDGYLVTIEVLELSRVPSTTDVLATYEVEVDSDANVTSFARIHRYYRNQTSRE